MRLARRAALDGPAGDDPVRFPTTRATGPSPSGSCGAQENGVPLVWVGGAHAYHQYHPTSSPPWQHLNDIQRNGRVFERRWGFWPIKGWLDAFPAAGAIERTTAGWQRSTPGGQGAEQPPR